MSIEKQDSTTPDNNVENNEFEEYEEIDDQDTDLDYQETPQTLADPEWEEAERVMEMSTEEFKAYMANKNPESISNPSEDKTPSENETDDVTEDENDQEQETPVDDKKDSKEPDKQVTTTAKTSKIPSTETTPQGQWTMERILKEGFKANGKIVIPKSADDLVRMAQQGVNYSPKMEKLKPMMRVMQTLNAANIHETELNDMLNVWKGEPEAIKKFLKDRNIEPTELDLDDINYVPTNYLATDNDAEFAEVAQEIRSSEYNTQIQDAINNVFDSNSKSMILGSPVILKGLLEEFNMGRFDQIMQVVQYDKLLKRVPIINDATTGQPRPMYDVEYYSHIAKQFDERTLQQQSTGVPQPAAKPQPKQKAVVEGKLQIPTKTTHLNKPSGVNASKASVAPTGRKIGGAAKTNIDPYAILEMSKEEFEKLDMRDFLS